MTDRFKHAALRVAAVYVSFSLLWILLSDRLLEAVIRHPQAMAHMQSVKGGFFVLVTGIGLYWLLRASYRRLEDSEARYRAVFNQQFQFLAILAPDGVTQDINEQPLRLRGGRREDYLGKPFWQGPACNGSPHWRQTWSTRLSEAAVRNQPVVNEDVYQDADGNSRYADVATTAIRGGNGELRFFLVQASDTTQRRLAEQERNRLLRDLQSLNEKLELRVRERTAELSAANARLHELDRLKSLFIASMSHELRTPLNSIIGFTGLMVNDMVGPISAQQRDHLQRAYGASKHLLALITDIIDISKIEAGKLGAYYSDFPLRPVVDEALATIASSARQKGLALSSEVPPEVVVHSDRKRLLQCLLNLLSNAVKYTDTGGVSLKVFSDGSRLEFAVSDTGIGIPEDDMAQLFRPFARLDSKLRMRVSGTGLGLYLTRKLARDVLNGEVAVRSRAAEGSTFTLSIPRRIEPDGMHEEAAF